MRIWTYNKRDSLTSEYKMTLEGFDTPLKSIHQSIQKTTKKKILYFKLNLIRSILFQQEKQIYNGLKSV